MYKSPCPLSIGQFISNKNIHKSKFNESSIFGLERLLPFPCLFTIIGKWARCEGLGEGGSIIKAGEVSGVLF